METSRTDILRDLLRLARPLPGIMRDLAPFGWDAETPLVRLAPNHIAEVLSRFLDDSLPAIDVEAWADAIEGRDDIDYDPNSPIGLAIHELSNPLLTEPLSRQSAQVLLAQLTAGPA